MTTPERIYSLLKQVQALKSKFQVIEVTDLRSGSKSYKVYLRGTAGRGAPVVSGIPTRQEAETKARELEENNQS